MSAGVKSRDLLVVAGEAAVHPEEAEEDEGGAAPESVGRLRVVAVRRGGEHVHREAVHQRARCERIARTQTHTDTHTHIHTYTHTHALMRMKSHTHTHTHKHTHTHTHTHTHCHILHR